MFGHDLHFAVRRLLRSPGFSATVVLLFGLALGANASLFSVLYGLLYKPLPFPDASRIVAVDARLANMGFNVGVSVPYLDAMSAQARAFDTVAAYRSREIRAGGDDATTTYQSALVQPAVLTLLDARPALGRLIAEQDTRSGAAPAAVIGWDLWQTAYGGSAEVLGRTIRLADGDYRIVGVMQRGFGFPLGTTRVWLPLHFSDAERAAAQAGAFSDLNVIARLRPGFTAADAGGELTAIARHLDGLKEIIDLVGFKVATKPLRSLWLGERGPALELMLLAVALVLLVATANVCNLYIARLLARRQELAVLDALGAGPWRRLRQTVAETLVLCLAGAAVGVATIPPALELLRRFDLIPAGTPQHIGIDPVTLAFIIALALLLALVMAASAIWLRSRDIAAAIRAGGSRQTFGRGAQRARQTLIVAQIALTAALLVGVGLLLRSSQRLLAQDVGFDRNQLAITSIADLPHHQPGAAPDPGDIERAKAAMRAFIERCRALPGVTAVGLTTVAPFGWSMSVGNFWLPGAEPQNDTAQAAANRAFVNADYFSALGAHLLQGRAFTPEETRAQADVAIVDTQFVNRVLGGAEPLGRKFFMGNAPPKPARELTIVGVVPTLKLRALDEKAQRPTVYQPEEYPLNGMLLLRARTDPEALAAPVREALRAVAPKARLRDVVSMRARIDDTLRDRFRLNALLELLGAMALALAAVGLYAVLAYAVRLRTAEFGVRMALGATRENVLSGVLLQGARLIAAGLLLGLPLAWLIARALSARLYQVGPFDAVTLAGVAVLLGLAALLACWLPARRAAATDPIEALRDE